MSINCNPVQHAIDWCNNHGAFYGLYHYGIRLKARFAFTRYCPSFVQPNSECTKKRCVLKHHWCNSKDVIKQTEIDKFEAIPCGFITDLD